MSTDAAQSLPAAIPSTLRVGVALLRLQAAGLAAVAAWLTYADLSTSSIDGRLAWAVTVSAFVGVALFAGYAWSLSRRWRLVRGLAVGTELIVMAPAYYMITGGLAWLGVLIAAVCLATIGALVAPPTNRALGY